MKLSGILEIICITIVNLVFAAVTINAQDKQIALSAEERLWLDNHPEIRVVQDPGWPPVEFKDSDGRNSGMTYDYLKLIEKRLGITFTICQVDSWQEAYAGLQSREFDMTTSVSSSPERLEFLDFTEPYMTIPIAIMTNTDLTYISSLDELNNRNIAIVKDYVVSDLIPHDFPEIKLVEVKSTREGLEMLQKKEVFGFIENMLVAGYYMTQLKLTDIKVAGETPYKNEQAMAVRNDWPILADILQKALDSITEAERDEIYFKWIQIRYEHGTDYTLLWRVLAVSAFFFLLLAFWIFKLRKEINRRTRVELALTESEFQLRSHLRNTPMGVIKWDREFIVREWNPAAGRIFGYTAEEITELDGLCMFPESDYQQVKNSLIQLISRNTENEQYRHNITDCVTKSGETIICEWFNTPIISSTGIITGAAALVRDITSHVLAEKQVKISLKEKEILLHELNHRTKNNMQLISSFLNLEARLVQSKKVDKLVEKVDLRILAISQVYEKLCQSKSLSKLNIRDYIEDVVYLVGNIYSSGSKKITNIQDIDEIELPIDIVVPLGLVITEIVTNTYKYAFPDKRSGTLTIQLHQDEDGAVILDIYDDGVGFPAKVIQDPSSFGINTVYNIIKMQLHGDVEITTGNGTAYHILMNNIAVRERL